MLLTNNNIEEFKTTELLAYMRYVAKISDLYEEADSEIKKEYIKRNIDVFREIVSKVPGNGGFFGTGYPFYALGSNFEGTLPRIGEQFDYNERLRQEAQKSKRNIWTCRGCISANYRDMPDLKQICKPCLNMDKELKPRKVINRLPDVDLWLVCADGHLEDAEQILSRLFLQYGLSSSDIDPIQTIEDLRQIAEDLQQGKMPKKYLPIDVHIMEYSKIKSLISQVPGEIESSTNKSLLPYLPIHPKSFRKQWQYDDEAYNFIHDYLLSFTEFGFNTSLSNELNRTRKQITQKYTTEELYKILWSILGDAGRRRFNSAPELEKIFKDKMDSWRRLNIELTLPQQRGYGF